MENPIVSTLRSQIYDAYYVIEGKGGEVPSDKTTANLAEAIESIPAGGDSSAFCGAYNKALEGWAYSNTATGVIRTIEATTDGNMEEGIEINNWSNPGDYMLWNMDSGEIVLRFQPEGEDALCPLIPFWLSNEDGIRMLFIGIQRDGINGILSICDGEANPVTIEAGNYQITPIPCMVCSMAAPFYDNSSVQFFGSLFGITSPSRGMFTETKMLTTDPSSSVKKAVVVTTELQDILDEMNFQYFTYLPAKWECSYFIIDDSTNFSIEFAYPLDRLYFDWQFPDRDVIYGEPDNNN